MKLYEILSVSDDLLETIYSQFQEYLLMKALRRIVVPEHYYPNEGKIELRQRAQSFLSNLGKMMTINSLNPIFAIFIPPMLSQ